MDSDWLLAYPMLLAQGVVPLPPFERPQFHVVRAEQPTTQQSAPSTVAAERVFTFSGTPPLKVTVSSDSRGLVNRFRVTSDQGALLDVHNTYRMDGGDARLDGFSVTIFGAHGRPARSFNGRVIDYRTRDRMPLVSFVVPRDLESLREDLLGALNTSLEVGDFMSPDDVARAIQAALPKQLRVSVDNAAFPRDFDLTRERLFLGSGKSTVGEVLLRGLRWNRMDFRFDPQGISIIPRSAAWKYADLYDYDGKRYNLSIGQLRDRIYHAAVLDDWQDVGGPARMSVDEASGVIGVFHTQSDHMRFSAALRPDLVGTTK